MTKKTIIFLILLYIGLVHNVRSGGTIKIKKNNLLLFRFTISLTFTSKLCIFMLPIILFSQNKITGSIVDNENNPVEFATINLSTENNVLIKTEISDEHGKFEIEEKIGNYLVEILYFGNPLFKKTITLDKNIDLGTLKIDNSLIIEQVTITKEKKIIERKVDRLVFNVENAPETLGQDVMDVLKIVPRVKVINDKISIIGKGEMSVMIDGRITNLSGDDLANYLKTLRSDDIKSIEVITNPPAKYSAEGSGGILNIVTKKQRLDTWNTTIRSVYQQSTYPIGLGGIGFNLKKNNITLTSDVSYNNGYYFSILKNDIYYNNKTWNAQTKSKNALQQIVPRLGFDYKISDKITNGFIYRYQYNNPKESNSYTNITLSNPINSTIDSLIISESGDKLERFSHNLNYHFIYDIDTLERKLSFDFDFFDYQTKTNQFFTSTNYLSDFIPTDNSFDSGNSKGTQRVNNYSFNLDMEHPFDWAVLNYGGRLSYIKNNNSVAYYDLKNGTPVLDTSQSDKFKYKEDTQALYFSAQMTFGEKWEAKAGLRIENTQLEGNSVILSQINNVRYTQLFPTAYLSFEATDNHSFSLDYSRRIRRPGYSSLNPVKWIGTPYYYQEGNPYLRPSFYHNIEFGYSFKDKWFSGFYFSYNDNDFDQISILDEITNIERSTYLNFLTSQTFGISQTLTLKPTKWCTLNVNADVYYQDTDSKIPETPLFLNGWNGEFNTQSDFMLNSKKTFIFSINYLYVTKGVDNLAYSSASNRLNSSIRWLLFDKKMTIRLYINDIFKSKPYVYTEYSNGIKNIYSTYSDLNQRFFNLSLLYSFGKSFDIKNRENKNEEETNRL